MTPNQTTPPVEDAHQVKPSRESSHAPLTGDPDQASLDLEDEDADPVIESGPGVDGGPQHPHGTQH